MNKPGQNKTSLRMTRQRSLILQQFSRQGEHLTADMVYANVRSVLPSISLGTVYRNLDILSRAGQIRKLDFGGGQSWYDGGLHPHNHVRCVRCGQLRDVDTDLPAHLDTEASRRSDYEITGHELEFHGLCPQCKQAVGNRGGGS